MPRFKDEPPAVRVYTVCDESRYLIVRNVPSLGCGDELLKLFATYGDIEECKPMDAEDCEAYTDVYWIKFRLVTNARFAKRKLDEFVFLGNRLQVSYAPQFETLEDTKEKLETRRKEVLGRLNPNKLKVSSRSDTDGTRRLTYTEGQVNYLTSQQVVSSPAWDSNKQRIVPHEEGGSQITRVSSEQDYFASNSMNQTVRLVRDKLDKIQSTGGESAPKKARLDNRRRI